MKNTHILNKTIRGLLASSLLTLPILAKDSIQLIEAPSGTISLDGSSYHYGQRPTIKLHLNVPQQAQDVINIGNPLSPDETTLHIKQDSQLKVSVISINFANESNNQELMASALVNAPANQKDPRVSSYWGNKYVFFDGSENAYKPDRNPRYDGGHIKGVILKENQFNGPKPGHFFSHLARNLDSYRDLSNAALSYSEYMAKNWDGKTQITVPVKKGDTVDFHIDLWCRLEGVGRVNADTRLRAFRHPDDFGIIPAHFEEHWHYVHAKPIETDKKQRQIVSLFDGMPIPLKKGFESQSSILELLSGYVRKRADGTVVADLEPNQMINIFDQNYKYHHYDGTPSRYYDMNDFVFLVEVEGRQELFFNDTFEYLLVKIDIPAPTVVLDKDGKPLLDDNGNYIDKEGKIIHPEGEDTITFDEVIHIDPSQVTNDTTFKFKTPNGRYGSVYKLVYIAKKDVNVVTAGTTENPITIVRVNKGEEVTIDQVIADSLRIPYSFAFTDLKDPSNPYATQVENIGPYRMISTKPDGSPNTFGVIRKVTGFIPPSLDPKVPRGAYAKLFKHRKYTYENGKINLKYAKHITENTYVNPVDVSNMTESPNETVVYGGDLPTKAISNPAGYYIDLDGWRIHTLKATIRQKDIEPSIAPDKNGEEHFTCYNYLARWGLDATTGEPIILGYDLYLPNRYRSVLKIYASPTATLEFTDETDAVPVCRSYPDYKAEVKNVYPKAKVYVRNRNAGVNNPAPTAEPPHINGNNLRLKDHFANSMKPDLGSHLHDGRMIMEVVQEIDYDGDGKADDIRILASKPWILKRSIKIKGEINSSK